MDVHLKDIAKSCKIAAEENKMSFPQIVQTLADAGFEGYFVDFRRSIAIYYLPDGDSVELPTHDIKISVASSFNVTSIQSAIREAQAQIEGYTYKSFCEKTKASGCAGYIVSFSGKRVVYFGRTAETHVEHFPR
jgi:uncharacterized protein YbcV (DUF1398 family)